MSLKTKAASQALDMDKEARNDLLPRCEGPKLGPFEETEPQVEFVRLLSFEESSSSGGHAHVFEVTINSKPYALKMVRFKFYDASEVYSQLLRKEKNRYPLSVVREQMDPFYKECRAYGRLVEKRLNGKVAIRCYGYLFLAAKREDELRTRFHVEEWNRSESDVAKNVMQRAPFNCIVKDVIRQEVPFTIKNLKGMLAHLRQIRRNGIFVMDIAERNYIGGRLIDFSAAMTTPHYLFETRSQRWINLQQWQDLVAFDTMIKDAKLQTQVRAAPNSDYVKKLRRPPAQDQVFTWL